MERYGLPPTTMDIRDIAPEVLAAAAKEALRLEGEAWKKATGDIGRVRHELRAALDDEGGYEKQPVDVVHGEHQEEAATQLPLMLAIRDAIVEARITELEAAEDPKTGPSAIRERLTKVLGPRIMVAEDVLGAAA